MWRRKQPQKESLRDEATPPTPGYVSAPPGYRYWSPTPSSSPNYYRKRLEPEEASDSSGRSLRRRVLSIVLIAILAVDLLAMVYGGYLSSWQLLTQPSGIFLGRRRLNSVDRPARQRLREDLFARRQKDDIQERALGERPDRSFGGLDRAGGQRTLDQNHPGESAATGPGGSAEFRVAELSLYRWGTAHQP